MDWDKARTKKAKGTEREVNFTKMSDIIVAGTEEGAKLRKQKRRKKNRNRRRSRVKSKTTPIVGIDSIRENSEKTNFKFTRQVMADIPSEVDSDASESEPRQAGGGGDPG